jgi:aldose 1-epimerase
LDGFLTNKYYLGCIIGRHGNRIANARFTLDGVEYPLAANNGPNNLHAGPAGFDKRNWQGSAIASANGAAIQLHYRSHDREEGFPGNLDVTATYCLTDDNELHVTLSAQTDKATICNLTYHPYFNLSGAGNGDILDHLVQINASHYTPINDVQIPTGEIAPVAGTPLDFQRPTAIGARIGETHEQLSHGSGYDHNWVIRQSKPGQLTTAANATSPSTGIRMEILSTSPGLQFYSGNFLDGNAAGKAGATYPRRSGFCMEPQHFPNSPNQPNFPTVTLRPGQTYSNHIIYRFTAH